MLAEHVVKRSMSEDQSSRDAPLLPDPAAPQRVVCGPRTYRLRTPRLLDRAALVREIAALGGRQHSPQAELREMMAGVRAAGDMPQREEMLAALSAQIDLWTAFAAAHREGDQETMRDLMRQITEAGAALAPLEEVLRRYWAPYAAMLGDNAAYPMIEAVACAKLFVVGWDGIDAPFPRLLPGAPLPDDALAAIPPNDLHAIAAAVAALMTPSETQRKN